ncbi:MAG: hypothetical protein FWC47_05255 [Oscillospiraceae bacterium]|nr:hypothetical protein [Oscillospiraceae bacterium]
MSLKKVMNEYYRDINSVLDVIAKLTISYQSLVNTANFLNQIGLSHRNDIKEALDRAREISCTLEKAICTYDSLQDAYLSYLKTESNILKKRAIPEQIAIEIEEDITLRKD